MSKIQTKILNAEIPFQGRSLLRKYCKSCCISSRFSPSSQASSSNMYVFFRLRVRLHLKRQGVVISSPFLSSPHLWVATGDVESALRSIRSYFVFSSSTGFCMQFLSRSIISSTSIRTFFRWSSPFVKLESSSASLRFRKWLSLFFLLLTSGDKVWSLLDAITSELCLELEHSESKSEIVTVLVEPVSGWAESASVDSEEDISVGLAELVSGDTKLDLATDATVSRLLESALVCALSRSICRLFRRWCDQLFSVTIKARIKIQLFCFTSTKLIWNTKTVKNNNSRKYNMKIFKS